MGTPEDLYDRSVSREVAEFIGQMNFVEGEMLCNRLIKTEVALLRASAIGSNHERVLVGLRPERVSLSSSSQGGENKFEAKVISRLFFGGQNIYEIKSKNHPARRVY